MAIHKSREAELPCQHNGAPLKVIQQDRRAIAPVVGLPALLLPGSIAPLQFERRLLQHIPVIRERLDLFDPHTVSHGASFKEVNHKETLSCSFVQSQVIS